MDERAVGGGAFSEAAYRATRWRGRFVVVGFASGEIDYNVRRRDGAVEHDPQLALLELQQFIGRSKKDDEVIATAPTYLWHPTRGTHTAQARVWIADHGPMETDPVSFVVK